MSVGCGEIGTLPYCRWVCEMVELLWKRLAFPQYVKHRGTLWPSKSSPRYITQRNEVMNINVHSIFIHNTPKRKTTPKSISGIKIRHSYRVEYYASVQNNEVLLYPTTSMNLESITLTGSQTKDFNILYDSIHIVSRMDKSIGTENKLVSYC